MYTIYCLEDINDLKYVGSTKKKLCNRFANHKYDKKINHYCSSSKLNLEYCIIYELETNVSYEDKKEREKYWINKIDCVNEHKLDGGNFDHKEYREKNKDRIQKNTKIQNDKFKQLNPDYNKIWSAKKWYCKYCNKEYNRSSKRLHLKSKTHQSNSKMIG